VTLEGTEQYRKHHGTRFLLGELRLVLAVVDDALRLYLRGIDPSLAPSQGVRKYPTRRDKEWEEVKAWFEDDNGHADPWSFRWCIEIINHLTETCLEFDTLQRILLDLPDRYVCPIAS